ncbi:MAG: hypothetical protein CL554_07295 [Algoriphagus sp.]|uniref:hypothetical protein n=1 Tax=Algoriphagus sp. TaxID=1872435 RepID=UPI000C4482E0|nr:hypothetical protein [Algoriphagus sp.]MAL13219.1 hypothetical protein [Algoriphagus sp.]|tara:strand:+ start:783 stop:1016 length:234 start_codon:yes stop_codon:yes gene_type:complete
MSNKENQVLNEIIVELVEENRVLAERNAALQDEVDSLWSLMDELTKSDVENFSHLLRELNSDIITKTLMVTRKKAEC